jgi:O-antigen/teichoic acid export membrane protein
VAPGAQARVIPQRPLVETVLTSFAGQATLVVSGVIVARVLGPAGRGELALIVLLPTVLVQLGGLGLPISLTFTLARDPGAARRVLRLVARPAKTQAAALSLFHAVTIAAVFGPDGGAAIAAAVISLGALPTMFVQQLALGVFQGLHRFRHFNLVRLISPALYSLFLVGLLIASADTLVSITIAWVVSNLAAAAIAWRRLRAVVAVTPSAGGTETSVKSLYRFGIRGVLGAVFPVESFQLDQLYVGLTMSSQSLGFYTVGSAFMTLPRLVAQGVGAIAYPRVAVHRNARQAWRQVWRYTLATAVICGLIVAALEPAIGALIPFFFGDTFDEAISIARLLLLAAFCQAVRWVLAAGCRGAGRPEFGTYAELVSWVAVVPALLLFGDQGAKGIAAAVTLVYGASTTTLIIMAAGATLLGKLGDQPPPGAPDLGTQMVDVLD